MVHEGLLVVGFALQLFGIAKATSSVKVFRDYVAENLKSAVARLRGTGTTGSFNIQLPLPILSAAGHSSPPPNCTVEELANWINDQVAGLTKQIFALNDEIANVKGDTDMNAAALIEADQRGKDLSDKLGNATWLVLIGTGFLFIAELWRICYPYLALIIKYFSP